MTACLCKADAEAVPGVRFASLPRGADDDLVVGGVMEAACISPAAVDILFVNDEIAHPAQEAASLDCGVLIRGAVLPELSEAVGGGSTVSAIVDACFRILCKYTSKVLLA